MGLKRIVGAMVLVAVVAGTQQGHTTHTTSFESGGHCQDYYASSLPVEAARAQSLLPDDFTVLDVGGTAVAFMFAMRCTTSIDGGAPVSSIVGGVAVFVDPISSPAGCQIYDWEWQDSHNGPWLQAMNDIGVPMRFLPDSWIVATDDGYSISVPTHLAPWSADARTVLRAVDPIRIPVTSVHCFLGPAGLVRSTYNHQFIRENGGVNSVVLGDGPLWRALGATSHESVPGLAAEFTWEGVTELLP